MIDEALDVITHDMAYVNYDETVVTDTQYDPKISGSGPNQIRQNIKIRLLMVKGEFFLNTTLGNIDFDALANKQKIQDALNKTTIKSTPGVISLTSYTSVFNSTSRALEVKFSATTQYGPIMNATTGLSI